MLVDEATGEERWAVQAHAGTNSSTVVAMSPSGRFVASMGMVEENWKLWEATSGAAWMAGARHDGTGTCICGATRRDCLSWQEGCPVVAHTGGLRALAFSPCGQRLASGDRAGAVILWDTQTGEAEQRMQTGSEPVCSLSFSGDGARLASGSGIGSIRVWNTTTGALLRTLQAPEAWVFTVHFSPTDNRILAVMACGTLTLWDVDSGEVMRSFAGSDSAVFSPDGRTIATASADEREVLLIDVESGALRSTLFGHQRCVLALSFSSGDGGKLASVSFDGTCKVWDSSTGALLRTIELGTDVAEAVSWGRDWVRDTHTGVAMGHHPRLGETSEVLALDAGVVRMILDRV